MDIITSLSLADLPTEIIIQIFGHILDIQGYRSLVVCCKHLSEIGLSEYIIEERRKKFIKKSRQSDIKLINVYSSTGGDIIVKRVRYAGDDKISCIRYKSGVEHGAIEYWRKGLYIRIEKKDGLCEGRKEEWYTDYVEGIPLQFHPLKQIISIEEYQGGRYHGLSEQYDSDGRKRRIERYNKGRRHGLWMSWYDNGQIACRWIYTNDYLEELVQFNRQGMLTGHRTRYFTRAWDTNGILIREYGRVNGTSRWYRPDLNTIKTPPSIPPAVPQRVEWSGEEPVRYII